MTIHTTGFSRFVLGLACVCTWASPATAQKRQTPAPDKTVEARAIAMSAAADKLYEQARDLIEDGQFDNAVAELNKLIEQFDHGQQPAEHRVDAAHYWKAYSQARVLGVTEAMATLQEMSRKFSTSSWMKDAKALELELKQSTGQAVSPDSQPDDDLKLLALRGLMQSDPERALPMIEQVLAGNSSPQVKKNALFVLSQSRSPRSREMIGSVARNNTNPELQTQAIRFLGMMRADEELAKLYSADTSPEVRRRVVQSLFISGNAAKLVELARAEKDPAMKRDIVQKLSLMKSKVAADYMLELLQ